MNKLTFRLVSLLLLASVASGVWAVPALPVKKTIKTAEGLEVVVTLQGDEHFGYYVDNLGQKYKALPSGKYEKLDAKREAELMAQSQAMRQSSDLRRAQRMAQRQTQQPKSLIGKYTGLVILAEFTDLKFTVSDNAFYKKFFNADNLTTDGFTGSVHDYFIDQSYGKFDLTFDVVGPVSLPENMAYYGAATANSNDANAKQFAVDAIKAASSQVDFSKYDWDMDRVVDQVFIIFPGYNQAEGGPDDTIWPHEWSISEYSLSYNGVSLATYGCASEFKGNKGSNPAGIGTSCHEFSHCLGLPDLYDTSGGDSFGMGHWDLMSAGNYLGDSNRPAGYTAYERWMSGWLTPVEISEPKTISGMLALEDYPEAYILYNDATPDEYYLLENRQPKKWGTDLNAHGLLVTHVDYKEDIWWYNRINTDPNHQRVSIIPADNRLNSTTYAGDPFPGSNSKHELTDTSTPAATLYNKNIDGSYLMGKPIENITESKGLISFEALKGVVAAPTNVEAASITSSSFTVTWDAIPEAIGYQVRFDKVPLRKDNPYEAILIEEDFATSCYSKSISTLNNIAGKLDDLTTDKGWTGTNLYKGPEGIVLGTKSKLGTLRTPAVDAPYYGLTTALVDVAPTTSGQSVKLKINLYIGGNLYGSYSSMTISKEEGFMLSVPEFHSDVAFEFVPDKQLTVSYFSLHDGEYSPEDFDKWAAVAPANVPALVCKPEVQVAPPAGSPALAAAEDEDGPYSVSTNSFVFENYEPGYMYLCSVRAVLGEDTYSKWSAQIEINPSTTSLSDITVAGSAAGCYDLLGRKIEQPSQRGIYIEGRKVILVK